MFGHYGWLAVAQKIDHPCAKWNSGRIYIHRCDVEGGLTLVEGDRVTFFLYVDDEGLGAEGCRLQRWDSADSDTPQSNATAVSTLNPAATEFVPAALPAPSALAAPGPATCRVTAPFPNCFAFNTALLDDFTDDEDDDSTVSVSGEESCDGDIESSGEVANKFKRRCGLKAGHRRAACKVRSRNGSRGSASTGISSDSEVASNPDLSVSLPPLDVCPPPGLMHPGIRPPPGLSLPDISTPIAVEPAPHGEEQCISREDMLLVRQSMADAVEMSRCTIAPESR